MRNIFLSLLLANLAFAAWNSWFAPAPDVTRVADSGFPEILLASEWEQDRSPPSVDPLDFREEPDVGLAADETSEGNAPEGELTADGEAEALSASNEAVPQTDEPLAAATLPAADGALTCVSVGPFRELSQAATAAANLRAAGFDPIQRAGEGDVWVGYWVYIEQIPDSDEANAILATLRENGMSDPYVIPSSDSGTLISLGVFTEIARASNRREAVRELGFEATISDRTRRATVYWIQVFLAEGQLLDFETLQPPGRIIRLEQRPCANVPI